MQAMMLALTDQEGGVGMNESPDRLGQVVLERLPCSSFKQQQTSQYILRSRFFTFFSHCFSYTFCTSIAGWKKQSLECRLQLTNKFI